MKIKRIKDLKQINIEKIILNQKKDIYEKEKRAQEIIKEVKKRGDSAIKEFTKKFDKVELEPTDFKVSQREIESSYEKIKDEERLAIEKAAENIESFHSSQIPPNLEISDYGNGKKLGHKYSPIESVGCYVPGGRAAYPSSVLMNVLPAKLAGVKDIAITTPPNSEGKVNPHTLVAADLVGIKEIYKIGGVQAIAALAFGTKTVNEKKKIVGPGGAYVTAAKNIIKKRTEVDLVAGPSEIAILADESSDIDFIIWDLLAQAEHGPDSLSILFTDSEKIARKVKNKLKTKIEKIERKKLIKKSLKRSIIFLGQKNKLMELINKLAPEHLEIMTKEPLSSLEKIKNAGAIFIGKYSPVAAGDYATGANHVLPTAGAAKATSGLSVDDFIKRTSVQYLTKDGLSEIRKIAEKISEIEGMEAHKKSIKKRFQEEE